MEAYSMPITPAPDDDHGARYLLQVEDVVGVHDRPLVELDGRRAGPAGCRWR